MNYLAEVKRIQRKIAQQRKERKKKVARVSLSSLSFPQFLSRFRPTFSYKSGYAFLLYPMRCLLNGLSVNIRKGSQVGATELLLSLCLFWLVCQQQNIFYMLPTDSDCSDFAAARFNPIIDANDELRELLAYDNVHHKRCMFANIYLRGGMTRGGRPTSKIKSVPVKKMIVDEIDEVPQVTLDIVDERLSGSLEKQRANISTPTDIDRGISVLLSQSAEYRYHVACCHCKAEQQIEFEANLEKDAGYYFCRSCKKAWTHEQKIGMVAVAADTGWKLIADNGKALGFHLPQLYSPTVTAEEVAEKFHKADNELKKQAFFNHKLGLPYSAEGARLTPDIVTARLGTYDVANLRRVAGIDVSQSDLHYVVVCALTSSGPVVERVCRAKWSEIPGLLQTEHVSTCVIDMRPETRSAKDCRAACTHSKVFLATYPPQRELFIHDIDKGEVKINRTEAIDIVLDRFRTDHVLIHEKVLAGGEFENLRDHVCAVSRTYREVRGEYEAYYTETGADHYLHALVYAEIAGRLPGAEEYDEFSGKFIS